MATFADNTRLDVVRGLLNDTGLRKNNFSAVAAPTVGADASQGYEVGSQWYYNGTRYACLDATNGAASWLPYGLLTAVDRTKLDGIASGATANATNSQLRDRATHTGTQAISTVSGLQAAIDAKADAAAVMTLEQLQDAVAAMMQGGTHTNLSLTYDDAAGTISFTALGGGGGLTSEEVQDVVGGLTVQGTGILATYNDAANTLTIALAGESYTTAEKNKLAGIATGATANSADATLLARGNHTGTQAISTVTGLQAALTGKSDTGHTHTVANVTGLQAALDERPVVHVEATYAVALSYSTANPTHLVFSQEEAP